MRYHTTGRAGMTPLDRVLYLADFTSADRDYPDVDVLRALTLQDERAAMIYALDYSIRELLDKQAAIHPDTFAAYNEYRIAEAEGRVLTDLCGPAREKRRPGPWRKTDVAKKPASRQVNLAEKSGGQARRSQNGRQTRKKGNARPEKIVAIVLLSLVVVVTLVFLIIVGKYVWDTLNDDESDVPAIDLTLFDSTPEEAQDKVAYYVVGVMGKDSESKTELLSLVCWDKVENTLDILQVPQDAYLGESGQWDVRYLGNVWNNPKPLDWCESCRRQVQEEADRRRQATVCGTAVTQKDGSAAEQLIDVFNDQYGVPVDDFFMLPQEAFVKLVNLLGGVDVELEQGMTVGEITYGTGVQPLDGEAALVLRYQPESGVSGDIDRLVRQRKVLSAILQRLFRATKEELEEDVLGPLQQRLHADPSYSDYEDMIEILLGQDESSRQGRGPRDESGAHERRPYLGDAGESASSGGQTFFTAHKGELVALLNEHFLPYTDKVTEEKPSSPSWNTKRPIPIPRRSAISRWNSPWM